MTVTAGPAWPPEGNRCPVCHRKTVLVNGVLRHLDDFLAARQPDDND